MDAHEVLVASASPVVKDRRPLLPVIHSLERELGSIRSGDQQHVFTRTSSRPHPTRGTVPTPNWATLFAGECIWRGTRTGELLKRESAKALNAKKPKNHVLGWFHSASIQSKDSNTSTYISTSHHMSRINEKSFSSLITQIITSPQRTSGEGLQCLLFSFPAQNLCDSQQ